MKITDYAPRAAPFDAHLRGLGLVGAEIGVDVGAHAEALLRYRSIDHLFLVDIWDQERPLGYCEGRLLTLGYASRVEFLKMTADEACQEIREATLDFIYFDEEWSDHNRIFNNLENWWPKLKPTGIMGYRNYIEGNAKAKPVVTAVNRFVEKYKLLAIPELGEVVLKRSI